MRLKLLEEYIKNILEARATQFDPKDIHSGVQSELRGQRIIDKTDVSWRELFTDLYRAAGPGAYISFVNEYDEKTPRFSVNPNAEWETPHGVYGYPLDINNLSNVVVGKPPTDAKYATDSRYIHLYKVSPGSNEAINITSSGKTDYDKKARLRNSSYLLDLTSIAQLSLTFITEKYKRGNQTLNSYVSVRFKNFLKEEPSDLTPRETQGKLFNRLSDLTDEYKEDLLHTIVQDVTKEKGIKITKLKGRFDFSRRTGSYAAIAANRGETSLATSAIMLICLNVIDETWDLRKGIDELIFVLDKYSKSQMNKFNELESNFHRLYFSAYIMSSIIGFLNWLNFNTEDVGNLQGSIFSLMLDRAGIKTIMDHGSSTVHTNEPTQAVVNDWSALVDEQNELSSNSQFLDLEAVPEELESIDYIGTYLNPLEVIFEELEDEISNQDLINFIAGLDSTPGLPNKRISETEVIFRELEKYSIRDRIKDINKLVYVDSDYNHSFMLGDVITYKDTDFDETDPITNIRLTITHLNENNQIEEFDKNKEFFDAIRKAGLKNLKLNFGRKVKGDISGLIQMLLVEIGDLIGEVSIVIKEQSSLILNAGQHKINVSITFHDPINVCRVTGKNVDLKIDTNFVESRLSLDVNAIQLICNNTYGKPGTVIDSIDCNSIVIAITDDQLKGEHHIKYNINIFSAIIKWDEFKKLCESAETKLSNIIIDLDGMINDPKEETRPMNRVSLLELLSVRAWDKTGGGMVVMKSDPHIPLKNLLKTSFFEPRGKDKELYEDLKKWVETGAPR